MLIYLACSAIAVFVSALLFFILGTLSHVAAAHLVFSVAVLPLIFAAITHFAPVLTRSRAAPAGLLYAPVLLQLGGGLSVLFFAGVSGLWSLHLAVAMGLLTALFFVAWLCLRGREALGPAHPGLYWYVAAVACLALALALVPAMQHWPQWRHALRLVHLHLNTLGFIGLSALGTLQVLLPTVLSGPDASATRRLRSDLWPALAGVLASSLGAALWWPLSLLGALLLVGVAVRPGLAWLQRYGWRTLLGDGASAVLMAALAGYLSVLLMGVGRAFGAVGAVYPVAVFIAAFLFPLVCGALSQLLPVWRYPGARRAGRDLMRERMVYGGLLRAGLFAGGAILLALGVHLGFALSVAALFHFACVAGSALWRSVFRACDNV